MHLYTCLALDLCLSVIRTFWRKVVVQLIFFRLMFRGVESFCYIYIYKNYRQLDLPWDSSLTWYLSALGIDFCYYWAHRACHGNNSCRKNSTKLIKATFRGSPLLGSAPGPPQFWRIQCDSWCSAVDCSRIGRICEFAWSAWNYLANNIGFRSSTCRWRL